MPEAFEIMTRFHFYHNFQVGRRTLIGNKDDDFSLNCRRSWWRRWWRRRRRRRRCRCVAGTTQTSMPAKKTSLPFGSTWGDRWYKSSAYPKCCTIPVISFVESSSAFQVSLQAIDRVNIQFLKHWSDWSTTHTIIDHSILCFVVIFITKAGDVWSLPQEEGKSFNLSFNNIGLMQAQIISMLQLLSVQSIYCKFSLISTGLLNERNTRVFN